MQISLKVSTSWDYCLMGVTEYVQSTENSGEEAIEVTHLFNHFRGMWSNVPKVIQNSKLDFFHKGRLQQKQAVAGRISKVLVGD